MLFKVGSICEVSHELFIFFCKILQLKKEIVFFLACWFYDECSAVVCISGAARQSDIDILGVYIIRSVIFGISISPAQDYTVLLSVAGLICMKFQSAWSD